MTVHYSQPQLVDLSTASTTAHRAPMVVTKRKQLQAETAVGVLGTASNGAISYVLWKHGWPKLAVFFGFWGVLGGARTLAKGYELATLPPNVR